MKRLFRILVLLSACWLAVAGLAGAATLQFEGKTFSLKMEVFSWPFLVKPKGQRPRPFAQYSAVQPQPPEADLSATALGSDLPYLRIQKVDIQIGQTIKADEPLVWYEVPLEKVIAEREALSRTNLDKYEGLLAKVNYRLALIELKLNELEKGVSLNTVPRAQRHLAGLSYESLLKQKEALSGAYDLTLAKYKREMELAREHYGKDFNLLNFKRSTFLASHYGGTVLWMNTSLKPGMVYIKRAKLFTVGILDPIHIRAVVYEMDLHKIKVGDKATVTFRAMPGQTFTTTIDTINYVAQTTDPQVPVYYEVDLYLQNHDLRIKEGMRCQVSVDVPDTPR